VIAYFALGGIQIFVAITDCQFNSSIKCAYISDESFPLLIVIF